MRCKHTFGVKEDGQCIRCWKALAEERANDIERVAEERDQAREELNQFRVVAMGLFKAVEKQHEKYKMGAPLLQEVIEASKVFRKFLKTDLTKQGDSV